MITEEDMNRQGAVRASMFKQARPAASEMLLDALRALPPEKYAHLVKAFCAADPRMTPDLLRDLSNFTGQLADQLEREG